ncbi:MAG: DUF1538 domain-containing protein [Sulfurimicrobium sp.]|jgi:hypothetical protein|nr:DUF1538 domain-containing protein [Sulfurimicrobium sp.]MDP2198756.1 DUF1538 domain-containing protein [Sulfurimicrobium sp.]MDP2964359.1 DUF1538 domain-containing protein [Sulfurimicrobium sp.]MDP3688038.1 DUF1538 domain-containing protein [Sulfurimicrobium sp.]
MAKKLRYGDYLGAVRHRQRKLSYNAVVAHTRLSPRKTKLRPLDLYRLLGPYIGVRFAEQLMAVVPLASFLVLFQFGVLNSEVHGWESIALGMMAVICGLMLFMEGVKRGLMPFSENIGYTMPGKFSTPRVLGVAFVLGFMATLAEPAIGALKAAGSLVSRDGTPYLHLLLNERSDLLVLAVGFGVGLAVLAGMLRFIYGWSLKSLIISTLVPALSMTLFFSMDSRLEPIIGLAWDCGAITTGPVTVPLVLAIGIGVSAATSAEDNPLSGFGIVTLASLFPPIAVMSLGLALSFGDFPVLETAANIAAAPAWYESSPFDDIIAALRAILPLTLFLWLVQYWWLKEPVKEGKVLVYGITLAVMGMMLFNVGLDYGLTPLGSQAGGMVPAAFAPYPAIQDSPLYPYWTGIGIALLFALLLGFGATVAEPALNAMGVTVQNLTDGAFTKKLLIRAVAVGVGLGVALGVAKVIFAIPIVLLLIPAYLLTLALTVISSEEYVNLAWDSAGVTTGPVTVPLVLALGLGLGKAVGAQDGFGILAMASVGPILSVLVTGLWIRWRVKSNRMAIERINRR